MGKTIIVNLFGGPSSGKSTTAAGLFHKLKISGVNCELVTEFAKHITWKEDFNTLKNQIYVFAKQHDRIFHLKDKVDVIITDSPTIIGLSYCNWDLMSRSFEQFVIDEFNRDDSVNVNYFINRVKEYNPSGRNQTEEEAKEKDVEIKTLLNKYDIPFDVINGDELAVDELFKVIFNLI
jgi:tRNA uridine 5-carbamoylmethylation protein Kti12